MNAASLPALPLSRDGWTTCFRLAMRFDSFTPPDVTVPSLIALLAGTDLSGLLFADAGNVADETSSIRPLPSLGTDTGCCSLNLLVVRFSVGALTSGFVPKLTELFGAIVLSSAFAKAAGCVLYGRLVSAGISETELAIFAGDEMRSGASFAAAHPCFSFATVDDPEWASLGVRPVSALFGISLGEAFCCSPWEARAVGRELVSSLGKVNRAC